MLQHCNNYMFISIVRREINQVETTSLEVRVNKEDEIYNIESVVIMQS